MRPADHEKIAATVQQLDADLPDDQRTQFKSHPLRDAVVDAVLPILRTMLPSVVLASDTKNNAITAYASRRDHQLIEAAIAGVQPNVPDENRPRVVVYHVPDADPVAFAQMLATILPTGRFSGDRESRNWPRGERPRSRRRSKSRSRAC